MRHNFIILTSKLQHEYLWFYISAKNGSVFKTIPEIHRKEIIRMKLLNWRFTLRYKSKPKRNLFLGHPVSPILLDSIKKQTKNALKRLKIGKNARIISLFLAWARIITFLALKFLKISKICAKSCHARGNLVYFGPNIGEKSCI